ncbi:hypothetical protein L6164_001046 [Bauhinia variegata]|uniref:Uncharacterized protein n=1 Tax=Bauhinia variegata TaxID=167791 RepID=A0ACB9Q8V9_BAUVA|nr:hypothetical protein L6164_001046 [Bauhinia variegata]
MLPNCQYLSFFTNICPHVANWGLGQPLQDHCTSWPRGTRLRGGRRSTFDAVVSGCIPVSFSPHTAYTQYAWYFPEDAERYSVYMDEKGDGRKRIEEELLKISSEKVEKMITLIPRITYAHPNVSDAGFKDAVDVALIQLSKLVHANVKNSDNEVPIGVLHSSI